MVPDIGIAHMSCLTVFCSVFFITFANTQGKNGTSAENLSCVIYTVQVTSMDCTWEAGRNAPNDVQYFLTLEFYENTKRIECPQYKSNALGRHVGCHFPNVEIPGNHILLQVTGSSKESPIQTLNHTAWPFDYEKLTPPQNITVNCHEQPWWCQVQWYPPPCAFKKNRNHCFKYEIKDEIRRQVSPLTGKTHQNYTIHGIYSLRFRAAGQFCSIGTEWSDWSKPIVFGAEPNPFPTVLLILVVLGTAIIILLLILLCKRFHIWRCLTFPGPQPKDVLWQYENVKAWVEHTPATDEKITVVEEMNGP